MWQKTKRFSRGQLVGFAAVLLLSVLAAFTGPAVTTHADWNDYKFTEMKFFESPSDLVPYGSRTYTSRFSLESTRYVSTEITVRNYLYRVRDFEINVLMEYVNPDGSLRGKVTGVFGIRREWESAIYAGGWGARDAGTWPVGVYTVRVYLDGRYAGSSTFEVYKISFVLQGTKFFENTSDIPLKENRRYFDRYQREYVRYIYTEVSFTNPYYNKSDHNTYLVFQYFRPDGSLLGEYKDYRLLRKDWEETWQVGWYGSNTPGLWSTGIYTVKIYADGQYLGSSRFEIY